MPAVLAAGVPLTVAVPLWLSTKVTPLGRLPYRLNAAAGYPLVVIVKLPGTPAVKVALAALVMAGPWSTLSVNAWVVATDGALLALIVMLYAPPLPAAGVPLSVAVPLVPAVKLTPLGRLPLSLSVVVAGTPGVVVIVKLPDVPTVKVALAALVMTGGWPTESVKLWVAPGETPLLAVIVSAYAPLLPVAGMPARVAVPLWLSTKATPPGRLPCSLSAAAG